MSVLLNPFVAGAGTPAAPLAFNFLDTQRSLHTLFGTDVQNTAGDGWGFYADFTYDGANSRYLILGPRGQAFSVSMNAGLIRVSNFLTFLTGSTTFGAGRYRVAVRSDGTTTKAWVKPESGSRTLEINASHAYATTRATDFPQMGGAFSVAAGEGADILNGKAYAIAYWAVPMTEQEATDLVDGVIEIGDTANAPLWWPDPNDGGIDKGNGSILSVKTYGDVAQLTAPTGIDNGRILRDPETQIPVTYDDGDGARYWMAYNNAANTEIYLASSTDLEEWALENQIFIGEGNTPRPCDFLYLGNISGGHDPFALLTVSKDGTESVVHARTSSDLSTWTIPTLNAANAIYRDTSLGSGGVEDFTVCRFDGAWYATYENDLLETGPIAVSLAKSTATLPTSGWTLVNAPAFTPADAGYNASTRFLANPVCTVIDGVFHCFYEGADFDTLSYPLPNTMLRTTATPEDDTSWKAYGIVYFDPGNRCFPNCVTKESGETVLYFQNGATATGSDANNRFAKIVYSQTGYLLVE